MKRCCASSFAILDVVSRTAATLPAPTSPTSSSTVKMATKPQKLEPVSDDSDTDNRGDGRAQEDSEVLEMAIDSDGVAVDSEEVRGAAPPPASKPSSPSPSDYVTPLPAMQVLLIAATNLINATSYLVSYPAVAFMVTSWDHSLTKEEAGYRSGFLEGSFHAGQFMGAFFWAWFADRFGRKPALQWGLLSSAIAVVLFGLSPSFSFAVAVKILWGFLNGNVGVAKTALSELCDDTNSAKAFSYIGVATGAGRVIGPIIGGFLSQPALKYPSLFSQDGFFGRFPFVLPCLIVAAITLGVFLLGSVYMIETRPPKGRAAAAKTTQQQQQEVELASRSEKGETAKAAQKQDEEGQQQSEEEGEEEEEQQEEEEEVSLIASTPPARSSKPKPRRQRDDDEKDDDEDDDNAQNPGTESKMNRKKSAKARAKEEAELDLDRPLPSASSSSSHASLARCRCSAATSRCSSVAQHFRMLCRVLSDPAVRSTTGLYTSLSAIGLAATELFPVFLVAAPEQGGFGWGSEQVGTLVAICGPALMVYQAFVYPYLAKKWGLMRLLRIALGVHALAMTTMPLSSFLTRSRPSAASASTAANSADGGGEGGSAAADATEMSAVAAILVVATLSRISSFSTIFVFIANAALPDDRSTANAGAQATASIVRFIFPPLATSLFAWSLANGLSWPFNYALSWYAMALATLFSLLVSYTLPSWVEKKRPAGV